MGIHRVILLPRNPANLLNSSFETVAYRTDVIFIESCVRTANRMSQTSFLLVYIARVQMSELSPIPRTLSRVLRYNSAKVECN